MVNHLFLELVRKKVEYFKYNHEVLLRFSEMNRINELLFTR